MRAARFELDSGAAKCINGHTQLFCHMELPHNQTNTFSVSKTASLLGVNRRIVQKWIRAGHIRQYKSGRVSLDEAATHMARPKVGRPPKGSVWKSPLFWGLRDTLAAQQAQPYLASNKLKILKQMLAVVAHWHTIHDTDTDFVSAVNEVLQVAGKMRAKKNSGDVVWQVTVKRYIEKPAQIE